MLYGAARKDLPLSTTEACGKSICNLLHLLLRMDSHAQDEIRQCATIIGTNRAKCVRSRQAFKDYRPQALLLSEIEVLLLSATIAGDTDRAIHLARDVGWLARS